MQEYFEQDYRNGNTRTGYWSVMSGICFWGGLYTWGEKKTQPSNQKKKKKSNKTPHNPNQKQFYTQRRELKGITQWKENLSSSSQEQLLCFQLHKDR